jgi:hypothetical protein
MGGSRTRRRSGALDDADQGQARKPRLCFAATSRVRLVVASNAGGAVGSMAAGFRPETPLIPSRWAAPGQGLDSAQLLGFVWFRIRLPAPSGRPGSSGGRARGRSSRSTRGWRPSWARPIGRRCAGWRVRTLRGSHGSWHGTLGEIVRTRAPGGRRDPGCVALAFHRNKCKIEHLDEATQSGHAAVWPPSGNEPTTSVSNLIRSDSRARPSIRSRLQGRRATLRSAAHRRCLPGAAARATAGQEARFSRLAPGLARDRRATTEAGLLQRATRAPGVPCHATVRLPESTAVGGRSGGKRGRLTVLGEIREFPARCGPTAATNEILTL